MPNWLERSNKQYLRSIASADLPNPVGDYIESPDLSAVTGFEKKYWTITGDIITLMSQAERDAVDAAEEVARRDEIAAEIDQIESYTRAFALAVLDEFNNASTTINAILDAADNATNLNSFKTDMAAIADRPQRTVAQLKTAVRNKLDQ